MNSGFSKFTIIIGLNILCTFATPVQQKDSDKDLKHPPAWYHLSNHQQPPVNTNVSPDQSPYGPRIQTGSNRPDSSFVPIPSPFQLPKPKSPQELAASQIVNAAQEPRQKDFLLGAEDAEYEEGFEFSPNDDDHQLYWRHNARRRRPSWHHSTTESPLKRILSREISNLERYLPLLARKIGNNHTLNGQIHSQSHHRSTTPIFLPSPSPSTRMNKRRKLLTTTPTTAETEWIHKKTKCHNCKDEDYEDIQPTTIAPSTRRRKITKKVEPCRSRKVKTTVRPIMPTLKIIHSIATTPLTHPPFPELLSLSSTTRRPRKSFAKWTKFTLSSRLVDPLVKKIATLKPLPPHELPQIDTDPTRRTTMMATTTRIPFVKHVLKGSAKLSQPWTHREQRPEAIGCPNGEVSPIELAIVWFVDHLKNKTTASTELIEAVKDALARFRSTLNHNRAASPSLSNNGEPSVGSEIESTWNEFRKGSWLERAFTELLLSDSIDSIGGGPNSEAAARKVDELWREAMLASALSTMQHTDPISDLNQQQKTRTHPVFHDQNGFGRRMRDSPMGGKVTETALNCDTFPMLCSILRTLKNNDKEEPTTTTIRSTTTKSTKKNF